MNVDVSSKKVKRSKPRSYSPELRERSVRMVFALRAELGYERGTVKRVAEQLDIGVESLRAWVHQAEIDQGDRAGTTSVEAERIKELERENRELRRANGILKSASAFFAAELDRPSK